MKDSIEVLNHFYETWIGLMFELGYLDKKEKPVDWLDQAKRFWEISHAKE